MRSRRFADLSRRMSVAIVVLIALFLLVAFSAHPVVTVCVVAAVCALVGMGVWEYGQLAYSKGLKPSLPLMIVVAVCVVIAFFSAHKWAHLQELPVFVFGLGLGIFFLHRFQKTEEALINVAVELFGVAYIAVPLSYMLAILYPIQPFAINDGRWWLLYLILVTKITDIGAYFTGRIIGKHPLAPILSPKKTVEGAVGGLIAAVLLSLAMSKIGKNFSGGTFLLTWSDAIWLALLISIFGQIGDLAESMLKRDAVVKDSNRIPGLGGILDMVDSLIFTSPIVYFYLKWLI